MRLSVIVPVGPAETGWGLLPAALQRLPADTELVFAACPESASLRHDSAIVGLLRRHSCVWLEVPAGRARQLNAGARRAQGQYLWFLHADSSFGADVWKALDGALATTPSALLYFRLGFRGDGPALMCLNAWGANLRSRAGIPFGDQGFCLSRENFFRAGGFNETAPYGEDHLLVWQVRRQGLKLQRLDATLWTSARKYREQGWVRLTLRYQWLWIRQALGFLGQRDS